ncbi:AIR carboxylase-domain-containing protein [Kalaharituber pfeilii]|nr:AIR carboxylase-domain-containing protein [Kalaharituber pfeilii]
MDPRTVGILGAGQLGRMMVEAAHRLNIPTVLCDVPPDAPAKQLNALNTHVHGSFADADAIHELATRCDVITAEIEHVDTHILEELEKPEYYETKLGGKKVDIQPDWATIRTIQDKYLQKLKLIAGGVATAEVISVEHPTPEGLRNVAAVFGYPYMLKARTLAYDGRGNYAVKSEEDIPAALKTLEGKPLYAERWAHFKMELAVMVVRGRNEVKGYPVAETVHHDSILRVCYVPARGVSQEILNKARGLAERAVALFPGKGVFGVEMFLMNDDSILINEIAPRPHNSGHYTIDACPTSQFDIHLRAILDLPMPPSATCLSTVSTNAIMINILGSSQPNSPWGHLELARMALSVPGATVHLYGKGPGRPGRKMGHITVVGGSMEAVEKNARPLIDAAFAPLKPPVSLIRPLARPKPVVSIIMGSDSDLPVLIPACQTLKKFEVPFECTVVSAHRTPQRMVEFAHNARNRGIRVIIAAAGGAAHLPGMTASETTLPVIGVPVCGSQLAGVDSILSIVQMPRGIPVATVGINNGTNAALLAVRIVALGDEELAKRLDRYIKNMEEEVLEKARRLETFDEKEGMEGWEVYLSK